MTIKQKTLEQELGILADKLLEVKEWYMEFTKKKKEEENPIPLKKAFREEEWDKWIIKKSSGENSD